MRLGIPPTAAAELAARYRQQAEATRRLSDYLLAVAHMAGVDPARVEAFDDETGELILSEDPSDEP